MRATQFAELNAFVAVAERRSFVRAAEHLGVARSTLSQNLRALEERLGARLLHRTTRSVSLTEAGEHLLARVRPALAEVVAAAAEVESLQQAPSGLLRIVVQPPVATLLIGPVMARFLAQYPGIRLDVSVARLPPDIVAEGFDAGIRFGEQIQRDMIAMRVMGEARFGVVASREYLDRHPAPESPRDLRNHNCIRNRLPGGAIFGWEFQKRGHPLHVAVSGTLIVDDIDLSIRAVRDGIGLAYLLHDYVAADIGRGKLVPLLEDWSPRLSGFFLYHSSRRQITPPLRALIDFLRTEARLRGLRPAAPRPGTGRNTGLFGKIRQ